MENQNIQKYRKSPYPFKSPHWKKKGAKIFNHFSSIAGDWRKIPTNIPWKLTSWKSLETPKNQELSEGIVKMLENFTRLRDFSSLKLLEDTLPLRYVFILPARHGMVIYSAYSMLISEKVGELASYSDVQEYLGVPIKSIEDEDEYYENIETYYYVYTFIACYLQLYDLTKPFRYFLGLPTDYEFKSKNFHYKPFNTDQIERNAKECPLKMTEWEAVSSPGEVFKIVHKLLVDYGFPTALQFVRYLYRASWKIRNILSKSADSWDKIEGLTKRYLNINLLLEKMGNGSKEEEFDQSKLDLD